jgi:glycosyltransferase involved in cell wall biosynthesis
VNVVQVGCAFDAGLRDADALLERYTALTGWSEALLDAGASRVSVVHRFHRDGRISRGGIEYVFVADRGPAVPRPWHRIPRCVRAIVEREPDVVHVNGLAFASQAQQCRRALPRTTALVIQDHAAGIPRDRGLSPIGWARWLVLRRALGAADGFLFSAVEQADPWRRLGLIRERQRVWPVMEASTTLRAIGRDEARARTGVTGSPALLWVGRLNANKDPLTILDGLARAIPQLPDATLTMVYGEGDLVGAVRERLARTGLLERRVRLVGQVPHEHLPAFYSAADLFVLGSHHEGSGFAMLEACACGAIPVVPDIAPFRVMTEGGVHGALWKAGDPADFARALARTAAIDLGAGRARLREHFERTLSWRAVGRAAHAAYAAALAMRREAACYTTAQTLAERSSSRRDVRARRKHADR